MERGGGGERGAGMGSGEIGRLRVGRLSDHYLLRGRSRDECSSLRDLRGGRVDQQKNMGLLED